MTSCKEGAIKHPDDQNDLRINTRRPNSDRGCSLVGIEISAESEHTSRAAFNEDSKHIHVFRSSFPLADITQECRNVLVRYCGHIPRNYQYKDGVQQIFLVLRDHLGDETLDLAGGVLYELIEIDCEHTDDSGAAFQRWRRDHMTRYKDLELPHVPHMTTITSSIIPTQRLIRWRSAHPERYPFVLSDFSSKTTRLSDEPSCIRNRKAWLIENTFYVSSRRGGTAPLNTPKPKEVHEKQWGLQSQNRSKSTNEKTDTPSLSTSLASPTSPDAPFTKNPADLVRYRDDSTRHRSSILDTLARRALNSEYNVEDHQQRRHSWLRGRSFPDGGSSFKDDTGKNGARLIPLPDGRKVPNASFARKHHLVDQEEALPPHLSISQMPIAESKATDTIVEAATSGLLGQGSAWRFQGPFTPQLGYDGGLDYRWTFCESSSGTTGFALDNSTPNGEASRTRPSSTGEISITNSPQPYSNQISGRSKQAAPFMLDNDFLATKGSPPRLFPKSYNQQKGGVRALFTPSKNRLHHNQEFFLFENVTFLNPGGGQEHHSRASHRKTTVVEISPGNEIGRHHMSSPVDGNYQNHGL
ncbi:hypothetical protein BX600DRAFT_430860 [Xylariales sp. PMI_506]|nr:hypothetical protein BX600DRAFT_430860 [Xylariales sp. PMI_506]